MEAFAPLPIDLFEDSSNLLEDDPNTYFSLSQFDLELQQQAQAALLQQENWQDFDKYLPVDNQFLFNDQKQQAQPIFNSRIQPTINTDFGFNNDNTILYEPLADLIPPQPQAQQQPIQQQSPLNYQQKVTPVEQYQQQELLIDDNLNWEVKEIIKQEYASPESLPYSPPQNIQSLSKQDDNSTEKPSSFKQTTPIDFMNWNNSPLSSEAKVPIQRLKSNTIIANAVNATLNNKTTTATTKKAPRQHKKTAHNAIERRYRNNINDRIAELKNAVPALLYAKVKDNTRTGKRSQREDDEDEGEDGEEFLDGVAVATKLNKATILKKATEYINHLKKTGDDVRRENDTLQHILSQLPGGADILSRYHLQKQQRDKEMHQQQIKEREALKLQEQQRKAANRKRAKHQHDHLDEYESSSSPGSMDHPVTPPAMTNRVFMALFMAISFFSTSPLTSGPTSSEQFENHHHATKTSPPPSSSENMSPPESFISSFFQFDDSWVALRTVVFMICIAQLFFPWIRYFLFGSSLKLKRVGKSKRGISPRKEISNSVATPGEIKTRHMYDILEKSIQEEFSLPESTLSLIFPLIKETIRVFSHHFLGYDIMYGEESEEEWTHICKWIKLNETRCVGGNPTTTRLSMMYSCFRMINLVDVCDEDCARAYATAAMQIPLIIPYRPLADRISDYFWLHAVGQSEEPWLQSLSWMDADQEYSILDMRETQAWSETLAIIKSQTYLGRLSLSLSYTSPVVVPIAILSTLHLLDSLHNQFDRLVSMMMSDDKRYESTAFLDIMVLTSHDEQQRLPHWLAIVGTIVETLWTNDVEEATRHIPALIQRVPRSMTCPSSADKASMHQVDEMVKKSMIHILIGAVLVKHSDVEKQKQGLAELETAQLLRASIRKNKQRTTDLESSVMALAEFVVSFMGLESWIGTMRLEVSAEKEVVIDEEVREVTLHLRRMIRDLAVVSDQQVIVERLSRLGRFIAHHPGDTDSACDLTDQEEEEYDVASLDGSIPDSHQALLKKADKAQLILRGLA